MLFSASAASESLSKEACRRTLPIFDGHQRYDLKLAFKRMDKAAVEKGYAGPVVVCSLRYEPIAGHSASNALVKYVARTYCRHAVASTNSVLDRKHNREPGD